MNENWYKKKILLFRLSFSNRAEDLKKKKVLLDQSHNNQKKFCIIWKEV